MSDEQNVPQPDEQPEEGFDERYELHPACTIWLTQKQIDILTRAAATWGSELELFVNSFVQLKMTGEARDAIVHEIFVKEMYQQAGGVLP